MPALAAPFADETATPRLVWGAARPVVSTDQSFLQNEVPSVFPADTRFDRCRDSSGSLVGRYPPFHSRSRGTLDC